MWKFNFIDYLFPEVDINRKGNISTNAVFVVICLFP